MKKLIFVAMLAIAASIYQPAKAQVSINVNIGPRPYYTPAYYTGYYVPARHYYAPRTVVVHRPAYAPARYYYSSRPVNKHYYKSYQKHSKSHYKGRGHGRH